MLLPVDGSLVKAHDDPYSDRIRCDHPRTEDGAALGERLLKEAARRDRGRVVVFSPPHAIDGLLSRGFRREAMLPGFYRGERSCTVMGAYPDASRARLKHADRVKEVRRVTERKQDDPSRTRHRTPTIRATREDAPRIAELLAETFSQYPTPCGDPEYLARMIDDGMPFRFIEADGMVVACASADLVSCARTAELTDCATRPAYRGRGYMQWLLSDLMDDLRALGYPTSFTLARASVVGMNLAFQRLGFQFRGTMAQSCRIGQDIEDMNVWSRRLDAAAAEPGHPTAISG
jgi:putative beta-lysine N-acetyltransferase